MKNFGENGCGHNQRVAKIFRVPMYWVQSSLLQHSFLVMSIEYLIPKKTYAENFV